MDWPYGFLSGNNLNFTHSSCYLYNVYKGDEINSFFQISTEYTNSDVANFDVNTDFKANLYQPSLISYRFINIIGCTYILSMDIISINGIQYITVDSISYGSETLVKGDIYNGTFELLLVSSFSNIKIVENYNNFLLIEDGDFISLNPPLKFQNTLSQQLKYINYTDLIDISYSINDLNIQDNDNYIQIYLNSSNLPHDLSFCTKIIEPLSQVIPTLGFDTDTFTYDSTLGLFTGKFIVKKNSMFGNLLFQYNILFDGVFFNSILPDSKQLRVKYTIYIELYDSNQILSLFDLYNGADPVISPFINFYENSQDGGININSLSLICPSNQIDTSKPSLISFNSSKSIIDVGLEDRAVSFTFDIIPSQSGVKTDQSPIIYITSRRLETHQCISKLEKFNSTYASYSCITQLPLGFGYPGYLLLSVYGIINNGGQYFGFSTFDLKPSGSDFYITTTLTVDAPILISNQRYFSDEKEIIIYGRSLSDVDQIETIESETGTITQAFGLESITFYGSSAIKITGFFPFEKQFYILARSTPLGFESNKLLITPVYFKLSPQFIPTPTPTLTPPTPTLTQTPPTPIPSNTPQKCLGNPVCGGEKQGYCSESGCVCIAPWIGVDCTSQVIIVPTPSINNTNPTIEIPIDGGNLPEILFKSLISLVSLREIDYNGQQVSNHQFDRWIYTPISDLKNQYTTTVLNTNITATLEWFNTSTTIEFANQSIPMNPSTIKYTIEITGNYEFTNKLNQLQLIMLASFESSKTNDICSSTQFGDTTTGDDSNYLKIQVDNHSLYGRFIKRAIVDGKFRGITNQLLDSSLNAVTSSSVQSFIAITIPQFKNQTLIDPDFSVLIDSNAVSQSSNNSTCSSSSSGLTTAQLAGIIVGSIAFGAVIIISIVYAILRTKKQKKFIKSMDLKLKNFQ